MENSNFDGSLVFFSGSRLLREGHDCRGKNQSSTEVDVKSPENIYSYASRALALLVSSEGDSEKHLLN